MTMFPEGHRRHQPVTTHLTSLDPEDSSVLLDIHNKKN